MTSTLPTDFWGRVIYILQNYSASLGRGVLNTMIIAVLATLDSGSVILLLSALSFLGLNVQPPTPEWGAMLSEARNVMTLHPWQMLPPGLAVLLVTAACNLLGDSLRDALSPRRTSRTR